ncbi:hypothetical protein CCDG5_1227 [[Clostridium] cellulosi]|uniref:ABC transporter domain-containing protein n=1 Tax=[Clostridium] cellulosi TaxID=29343 RepID=A0A078KKZ3_9FIRM|nr:hypothetical protein CCDG5_1227 [[Clostridium] cellulosi]
MENLLEIKHLKVSFFTPAGEVKAVNDISYTLGKGEILGVVGESGSGKSVTASTVMGLVESPGRIVGGSVIFDGKDVTKMSKQEIRSLRGREIGMIF